MVALDNENVKQSNISVPLNTNIQLGSVKSSNKYNEFELIKLQKALFTDSETGEELVID